MAREIRTNWNLSVYGVFRTSLRYQNKSSLMRKSFVGCKFKQFLSRELVISNNVMTNEYLEMFHIEKPSSNTMDGIKAYFQKSIMCTMLVFKTVLTNLIARAKVFFASCNIDMDVGSINEKFFLDEISKDTETPVDNQKMWADIVEYYVEEMNSDYSNDLKRRNVLTKNGGKYLFPCILNEEDIIVQMEKYQFVYELIDLESSTIDSGIAVFNQIQVFVCLFYLSLLYLIYKNNLKEFRYICIVSTAENS